MQNLAIRPRWLLLSAGLVAILLIISVSTGMALGDTSTGGSRARGFAASGPGACNQTGFGGPQFPANTTPDPITAISGALNVPVTQLQQELSSGQTISQIISAHHMTNQQVSNDVTAQQKDQLDQQVANGRISLEQESAILASQKASMDDILSGRTPLGTPGSQTRGFGQGGFNGSQGGRGRVQPCGG